MKGYLGNSIFRNLKSDFLSSEGDFFVAKGLNVWRY